jgi:thiamine-monophosphate kinase
MLRLAGMTAQIRLADVPLSSAAQRALRIAPHLIEAICGGGDDYEILCAAPPENSATFESAARSAGLKLTSLGRATSGDGAPTFLDADGHAIQFAQTSFQHFNVTS